MASRGRIFAKTGGATLASQLSMAVGLLGLQALDSQVADQTALLLQGGVTAFTAVVLGLTYNLAVGRPGFDSWRKFSALSAVFAVLLVGAVGGYLYVTQEPASMALIAVASLIVCAGSVWLMVAGTLAVRLACNGSPMALAGILVPANVLFSLAILAVNLVAAPTYVAGVVPLASWSLGCGVSALLIRRASVAHRTTIAPPAEGDGFHKGMRTHFVGLLIGVLNSGVFPLAYLACLTSLSGGTLALALLLSRVGTSLVSISINSMMLVYFNWSMRSRLPGGVVAVPVSIAAICCGVLLVLDPDPDGTVLIVLIGVSWFLAISASAMVSREANALASSRSILVKSICDTVSASFTLALLATGPSIVGYFSAFIISSALTVVILSAGAKRWGSVVVGIVLYVLSLLLLVLHR